MKKVLIADNAGFCFGVKRAMNMAWNELESSSDKKIYALGPLIHNKQAVEKYEEKGLVTIDKVEDVLNKNSEMIIRSHGVSKEVYDKAKSKNIDIVDTTCPFVKKIHEIVENSYSSGMKVIVIGDKNHPEVIGINGWCENNAIIFKNIDELNKIKLDKTEKYIVVAQTTMNERDFEEIISCLNDLELDMNINNTICSATKVRQQSARDLAQKVELMLVVGGKHSSNTQKLVIICKEYVKTIAIETRDDLLEIDLSEYTVIGVTAGASTPNWIIEDIISYLNALE